MFSPWTDLALAGASWETRAEAELYFARPQMADLARAYLGDHDPGDPLASPLYTPAPALAALPPVQVHVRDNEVLLDDALGYGARAAAAGADVRVDVWRGMPHVFVNGVGRLGAAACALDAAGAFLAATLTPPAAAHAAVPHLTADGRLQSTHPGTTRAIMQLTGNTILITGGGSGIGRGRSRWPTSSPR